MEIRVWTPMGTVNSHHKYVCKGGPGFIQTLHCDLQELLCYRHHILQDCAGSMATMVTSTETADRSKMRRLTRAHEQVKANMRRGTTSTNTLIPLLYSHHTSQEE
jgi:hypothetical protein